MGYGRFYHSQLSADDTMRQIRIIEVRAQIFVCTAAALPIPFSKRLPNTVETIHIEPISAQIPIENTQWVKITFI